MELEFDEHKLGNKTIDNANFAKLNLKLENDASNIKNSDTKKAFDNLNKNPNSKKRLEEIISYIKVQKQPFHESELANIFDQLDIDGDNSISNQEIKRFFQTLRNPVNDFYVDKIIKEFDKDNNGDIDKNEFLNKMKNQSNKSNNTDLTELLEIFKYFDANHDEKICHQDFQNILKALGENFDVETCKEMMKQLGDSDGKINFSQFFELVKDEGRKESFI
jgi:Ca2+-binding EF-hand superfamily protein